jgi:Uma2 family endonuclease
LLTAAEYLAFERASPTKHKLFQGQLVAMAGASLEHYYYPDASVVCGTAEFADSERDAIVNPTVVVEVLSDSTERRDRGEKFHDYRSIPSCTDYLMCSSTEPFIEHYTRDADGWRLREYGPGEVVTLRGVEMRLSVAEVYAKAFGGR